MEAFTTREFELHFKALYKPLCLFALRFTGNTDDAEDIVQQTFADVWDKRNVIETIDNFKSYLYRAVRNRSINLVSQHTMHTTTTELPEITDISIEEEICQAERYARLWDVIDRLPHERKKIFLMSKRDGMKYSEIAEELSISVKTVENQMGKALKALRDTAVYIYRLILSLI